MYLIDKPIGWTSFDVVAKIRNRLRRKEDGQVIRARVGHAGTLDPFATGLLIILVDQETKLQDHYLKLYKTYQAELTLGKISTTNDPEGIITPYPGVVKGEPTLREIERVLGKFTGKIKQVPPVYSAIKIDGQRAYRLARKGLSPKLKEREIEIYDLKVAGYQYPILSLKIECSSGTYIRKLAEDIGLSLGCGAYCSQLRRIKIGSYDLKDAVSLEQFPPPLSG